MKLTAVLVGMIIFAFGQDTRKVVEPMIPPACAAVAAHGAAIDDGNLDTARIQEAIDKCGAGKAVELKGGAFVSGPLQLRSGVTLLIDHGATLYASRNPRAFDNGQGRCGT